MPVIKLNLEAGNRIKFFKEHAKGLGLRSSDWTKIISQLLLHEKEEAWWKLINRYAEESFLIGKAISDPEVRGKLLGLVKSSPPRSRLIENKDHRNAPEIVLRKHGERL